MGIDDTERMVTGKDSDALVLGSTSAHEILDVVLQSLKENPGRADLWMMRFDILRTTGLRFDFAQAMREANANTALRREIDWAAVGRMWREVAPGMAPPDDVQLPKSETKSVAGEKFVIRRFSDLALRFAAKELDGLSREYQALRAKPDFFTDFARKTRDALQRPTPLVHAEALEGELDSVSRIFIKREDLRKSTPESEIAIAHAYIATALGKNFILTGNDVDEFSLALAQIAPRFGLKATIVVRTSDFQQKAAHIARLRDLGAQVEAMRGDTLESDDPREGALILWTRMLPSCHLALSFGTGPNPYPRMTNDFQMLLGYETELQLRAMGGTGRARILVAAVQSEADSIGFVLPYLKRTDIELFYAESPSVAQGGWKSSARLRAYNGARREHAWLRATGRITHIPIIDAHAREAQDRIKQTEGISIGLEDARAVALVTGLVQGDSGDRDVVVLVS